MLAISQGLINDVETLVPDPHGKRLPCVGKRISADPKVSHLLPDSFEHLHLRPVCCCGFGWFSIYANHDFAY